MVYLDELPYAKDMTWVDGFTRKSDDTIIYITICGGWHAELLEAMDCLYLDNKREFELIQMKTENKYLGACVMMKPKKYSVSDSKKDNGDKMAGTCQGDNAQEPRKEA